MGSRLDLYGIEQPLIPRATESRATDLSLCLDLYGIEQPLIPVLGTPPPPCERGGLDLYGIEQPLIRRALAAFRKAEAAVSICMASSSH